MTVTIWLRRITTIPENGQQGLHIYGKNGATPQIHSNRRVQMAILLRHVYDFLNAYLSNAYLSRKNILKNAS